MKYLIGTLLAVSGMVGLMTAATADPTVYFPPGPGNQIIAVDAATDKITASFPGIDNPHRLVTTPDGDCSVIKEDNYRP